MAKRWGVAGWAILVGTLGCALPGWAQEREYAVSGAVVTVGKAPVPGAVVEMRERTSRRAFKTTSDAEGKFRMFGLSHGVYEVSVSKAGYQSRTDEWNLSEPQSNRMKKVELEPYVLMSEAEVGAAARSAALKELLGRASEQVRKGECTAARDAIERLLAADPNDANALYMRALCEVQEGQLDVAVASLRRVTELAPGFAAGHLNLGVCLDRRGDSEGALVSYEAVLALEPDNQLALYNAGVLHYNSGRVAAALPYFARAAALKPDDDRALEMVAYCHLQAQRLVEALDHLQRARALVSEPQRAAALDELIGAVRARIAAGESAGGGL
ncbi:MAG: tetratricopeptide repeat protein [Acidobacteria bacterium]|nr:tetratricopeptide repeat protein [Acidobacteriota bacterium]